MPDLEEGPVATGGAMNEYWANSQGPQADQGNCYRL